MGTARPDGPPPPVGSEVERRVLAPPTRAELYNVKKGTWSAAAPMAARRGYAAGVLLATGQVLVAGGVSHEQPPAPSPAEFICHKTAELYDRH